VVVVADASDLPCFIFVLDSEGWFKGNPIAH
jgi:hypothetical protein